MTRRYFGSAAHLIVSNYCRFHLATQIGDVLISTVGEYYRTHQSDVPTTIGCDRLYETMVFRVTGQCECGCGLPMHDGCDLDFAAYQHPTEANAGHEAMCQRWEHGVAPLVAEVEAVS